MCIYVAVVVLVDNGLRGGIDLTVQQEMDCAQGQRMGTISAARQRAPAVKTKPGKAKPSLEETMQLLLGYRHLWLINDKGKKFFELKRQARGRQHPVLRHPYPALPRPVETLDLGSSPPNIRLFI